MTQEPARFLVGGEWRTSGVARGVTNPYSGQVVEHVYQATPSDIDSAIGAAEGAFAETRVLPSYRRGEILDRIADGIASDKERLAQLMTLEMGKPITYSRIELDRCVFTFRTSAEEARRMEGHILPLDLAAGSEGRSGYVRRFPLGPITAITPFNFPLNLVAHKLGPALAVGNTVILKPSSSAPRVSLELGKIILKAGYPACGINIVPCKSNEATQLVLDQRIKLITFTGSPAVGWPLKAAAGKKKVTLELGGNAGVIVDASANLDFALKRLIWGSFAIAGQSCIAVQRIFIHTDIADDFLERFIVLARDLASGDPFDEKTVVGPMITEEAAANVESWVRKAVDTGARVLCGGTRRGAMMEPTVLVDVRPDLEICSQEVFAPVVTVERFEKFEDAVSRVNNSAFGLQAGVFTNDLRNAMLAFDRLEVGGVVVNDASTYRMDHMPYGGVKDSGFGREGIRYAMEEMTESKLLALNVI